MRQHPPSSKVFKGRGERRTGLASNRRGDGDDTDGDAGDADDDGAVEDAGNDGGGSDNNGDYGERC